MKKIEKIVDAITGEETVVERDETSEEKKYRLAQEKLVAEQQAEAEARAAAKTAAQAKLAALGLTVEDLTALGL
jgi:hypothetical protein